MRSKWGDCSVIQNHDGTEQMLLQSLYANDAVVLVEVDKESIGRMGCSDDVCWRSLQVRVKFFFFERYGMSSRSIQISIVCKH